MALDGRLRERIRASTRPECECGPKRPYPTAGGAWEAVRRMTRRSRTERSTLHAYKCSLCHHYHVGHLREEAG